MEIMKKIFSKNNLSNIGGVVSGGSAGIGSLYQVCHSLCMSIVGILAGFGITLNILPLMFLQTYQVYFWLGALFFTVLSFSYYSKQTLKNKRDRNLLLINVGLLIFSLPIPELAGYMDFFRFIGGLLVLSTLGLIIFKRKIERIKYESGTSNIIDLVLPSINIKKIFIILIAGVFLFNQYLMWQMTKKMGASQNMVGMENMAKTTMKFTPFDVALAKERMDKNNDGICDTCGMGVQQCIDAGQMDCNMGKSNPQAIGIAGSQHIHTDLNIYNNGQRIILAKTENYMKSSLIHLDNNQNADDSNSVLHMHATKVPLLIFFRSLGMNITKEGLTLSDGQTLKNENGNTLKFYVNGQKLDGLGDYVFQPLDKVLVSYGPSNDPNINNQIRSMTDFAKNH